MKKVLVVLFAIALATGFAYAIDAEARCGMMGGGCGMGGGSAMSGMKGGCGASGCGMASMGGTNSPCGHAGCMCGPGCPGPGCMCGAMSGAQNVGKCGTPGCVCGASCPGAGCQCGMMSGMGGAGGQGMANPMMKVFLEDTRELRKTLHMKRFEYAEAARDFDVSVEEIMKMEKEIKMLQMKINRYWLK
jgi:hypothetical protein